MPRSGSLVVEELAACGVGHLSLIDPAVMDPHNVDAMALVVDAWRSGVRYSLEHGAIRVPLTQVEGVSAELAAAVVSHRGDSPTLTALLLHVDLPADRWDALARAGAFDSRMPRRDALWQTGLARGMPRDHPIWSPGLRPALPGGTSTRFWRPSGTLPSSPETAPSRL